MNSVEMRKKFLDFFKKNGHTVVSSSSLIPAQDPTLLFTNAGMNQFKDVFLGKEKRGYVRATSSQKCVRAGGKHNDLDEVGFTNRHLTFFEMLGNFSFGDYFKKEAIEFGWKFLTEEMGLDKEKLVVSVYKTDDEAYEIWEKNIGVKKERIFRLGEKENFWQMGDTGPCGPCTEIHLDNGVDFGCKTKFCDPSCDCGRFVEIWNLVFMQYDRQSDGKLNPLKQTGVDTGMGLERLCMIMQKKDSIFRTDLFDFLIKRIEELTAVSYSSSPPEKQAAFHVLCDHVRSSCLLIADGCTPSNEGRGYVLRKIIRRAALFTQKLGVDLKLFSKVADTFIDGIHPIFPNLKDSKKSILSFLSSELERFAASLDQGQQIFEKYVEQNKAKNKKTVSGQQIFKLYDTYGFPPELTRVMAYDQGFSVDMKGFDVEMKKQREQSGKKDEGKTVDLKIPEDLSTKFVGYESLESKSKISFVKHEDDSCWIVTEESPFYVESGGQEGDSGWMTIDDHSYVLKRLQKVGVGENPAIAAQIIIDKDVFEKAKNIKVGQVAHSAVDGFKREKSEKNHTATHLLQAALTKVLGSDVKQAGSLVNSEYLRFDFNSPSGMTKEQIEQVEQIVNQKVQEDIDLKTFYTTLDEAQKAGVFAFFGEKYNPEHVRVVKIPGFSAELCGGTHTKSTGEVGCFKITSEAALAAGVRRIVAVTGPEAIKLFQNSFNTIKILSEHYKAKPKELLGVIKKQNEKNQELIKEIKQMRKKLIKTSVSEWIKKIEDLSGVPFLFLSLKDYDIEDLRLICKEVEKEKPGFYFLISDCSKFVGFVSKDFSDKVDLKRLSVKLKESCGLRGGGKADLIQGGGADIDVDKVKKVIGGYNFLR